MEGRPVTEPGTVIAERYRVLRAIGQGGMGRVYLVEDLRSPGRQVALKTIRGDAMRPGAIDAFKHEFKILVKLRHPNVAKAYEFGQALGTSEHYFTTEFVEGTAVAEAVKPGDLDRILDLAVQILRGLAFVHSRGLVHHDIKAGNLLVPRPPKDGGADGLHVKIIDFGLVATERQATDVLMGSPSYLAPERIRRQPADRRADLYSFGVVLFRLLTGRLPFRADTLPALLERHLRDPAPKPSDIGPDLPRALDPIVVQLLAKDPAERFDSAADVIEAVNEALGRNYPLETVGSREGYIASGALVGRQAPLDLMGRGLDRALRPHRLGGRPAPKRQAFLLLGERGVGKSRLLEEVRIQLELQDAVVLSLACPPGDGASPRLLLDAWRWIQERCRAAAVPLSPAEARILPPGLLPWSTPAEAEALFPRLLAALAERSPVGLVLDDLQEASDLTWRVLAAVAMEAERRAERPDACPLPLFLFVAARTVPAPAREGERRMALPHPAAAAFERIELGPLKALEIRQLLRGMFGNAFIPESVLTRLLSFSQGNPFLLEEALRSLAEKGHLKRQGDLWICTQAFDPADLRENLADLLLQRLGQLSAEGLSAVRAVAAFVGSCPGSALEAVAGSGARVLEGKQAGLVTASPDGSYALAHPRLREAILGTMDPSARAALHRAVLRWLDGPDPRPPRAKAAERIEQAALAGEPALVVDEGIPAAEGLGKEGDHVGAARIYARVLGCLPPGNPRLRAAIGADAARAFDAAGDGARAKKEWREIVRLPAGAAEPAILREAHRRIGEAALEEGRPASALRHFRDALGAGAAPADPSRDALIREGLAQAERRLGDLAGCAATLQELKRTVGFPPAARRTLAEARALAGKPEEAREILEKAEAAAHAAGDPVEAARCALALASILRTSGLYAEAVVSARRARTLAEGAKGRGLGTLPRIELAWVALLQGRLAEAEGLCDGVSPDDARASTEARRIRAGALLKRADAEGAWSQLREAQSPARLAGDRVLQAEATADLLDAVRALGLRDEAISGAERLLAEVQEMGVPFLESRLRRIEAGAEDARDEGKALARLQEAERLARAASAGYDLGRVLLDLANLAIVQANPLRAGALLDEAEDLPAVSESLELSLLLDLGRAEAEVLCGGAPKAAGRAEEVRRQAAESGLEAVSLRAHYVRILSAKGRADGNGERDAKIELRAALEALARKARPPSWRALQESLQRRYDRIKEAAFRA